MARNNIKWEITLHRAKTMKARKTRKNCFRYLKLMSPLNATICTTISYTLWVEWYYLKNNFLTLRSKSHEGHYGMWHTPLWSCTHIPNIIDLPRKTKCYGPDKKILFKKQLLQTNFYLKYFQQNLLQSWNKISFKVLWKANIVEFLD